jgi:nucleoside 2-deoxyribosyltransferase
MGFTEAGRDYLARVVLPALLERGYRVLDPWEDEAGDVAARLVAANALPHDNGREEALGGINEEIGRRNVALIEAADAVIALLDGPDVDSGTAAEIGYAAALGRPIVGWRTDLRRAGENDGTPVNLQIAHLVDRSGGSIAFSFGEALDALDATAVGPAPEPHPA